MEEINKIIKSQIKNYQDKILLINDLKELIEDNINPNWILRTHCDKMTKDSTEEIKQWEEALRA